MKMPSTLKKRIYVPLILAGALASGCHNNDKVAQPTVGMPNSTASTTSTTTTTAATPAPSADSTVASTTAPVATDSSASSTHPDTMNSASATNGTHSAATSAPAATATTATTADTSAASGKLNDVQIADVVKAANDAEIGAGTLAKTRAENPQVRAYAKKMIDEHSKNNASEKSILAKKSDATLSENEVSKSMRADSAAKLSKLQNMSGSAFDQAYIDEQVKMHKQLLSDLDNNLIPAAKDAKLKSYLQETRKHVSQHLEGAQQVLSMINSGI